MFKTLGVVPKLIPNTDFTADKPFSQTVLFIKLLDGHRFLNWSKLNQRKWKFYVTLRKNDNSAGLHQKYFFSDFLVTSNEFFS